MSKITIDETEYCQEQHALKHYALLMKAIAWRNATYENLSAHCDFTHSGLEQRRAYNCAHHLNRLADEFFDILTGHSSGTLHFWTDRLYQQTVKELLA